MFAQPTDFFASVTFIFKFAWPRDLETLLNVVVTCHQGRSHLETRVTFWI
jgi:hypothetical protein